MDDRYIDNRASPRLALRVLVHSFRFHGRSTRTEVVSFWFFGMVADVLAGFAGMTSRGTSPPTLAGLANLLWPIALVWPFFPLLVRRLHDQGRSWHLALVWPAILVPDLVLLTLPDISSGSSTVTLLSFSRSFAWTPLTTTLLLESFVAMLAGFVLYLLPPTPGDNRYGPDPRRVPADETINFGDELATR